MAVHDRSMAAHGDPCESMLIHNGPVRLEISKLIFESGVEEQMSKHWHFAMSGKDWAQLRQHFPLRIPYIIQRGTVFARMSPDQKAQLIDELKKIDYQVGVRSVSSHFIKCKF